VQIDFDPLKNHLNFLKHGLYLELARQLDWEDALIWAIFASRILRIGCLLWCQVVRSCFLSLSSIAVLLGV